DGTMKKETRILGGFKPNDEAPGGRFARRPLEEVQPGLPPQTADLRQNLVSKLGGAGSMDSVLVMAQHVNFNYVLAGTETEVAPIPKEGIFIEWMTPIPGPRPNFVEFINAEKIDNEFYSRVYEDVAFANWDPNEGNQLISASTKGRVGVPYSWKQFDLDKAFPAGFVSMSNDPVWSKSPEANQPMPPTFQDKIRARDVEKEIEQAQNFWNGQIDLKQARIIESDDPDKEAKVSHLEACRWTEAHANVLRARDTLLKVAVDLNATPIEIFEMIREVTVEYNYSFSPTQLREFLKGQRRIEISPNFIPELTRDLHCFLFKNELTKPVDVPNRLALEFIVAKAKAIVEIDKTKQDALGLTSDERKQEIVKLTQENLARQLRKQMEHLRSRRLPPSSSTPPSSSSSSSQP
ncbi:MAG: hypothetical protein K2Z81_21340, partial [Cyanobacteria bacterium]|nr:hypothetical protein [Cyanobacteriota bacterium]